MTIEFKSGAVWRVVGSDNPDSLVGAPPAGIVFSEWALSNPSAWGYLAPILDENGGWAIFIATPRGRNHFKQMMDMALEREDWFAEILTPNETGYPQDRIENQREEYHAIFGQEAGDALIEQEYWCSFEAAILGAYYGKELSRAEQDGRICQIEAVEDAPVHTAWDLGVGDAMAIWFWQAVPGSKGVGKVQVLDYYESHGYGIAHYADEIRKKRVAFGWGVGTDFVPHDAKVREMTSSGHDGKAKQRVEVMIECGLKPKVIPQHKIMDGIQAVRQLLPRCSWHTRCNDGLERLRQYRAEWDDDRKTFRDIPCHDWTSHGADAVRTMAMAYREVVLREPPPAERRLQIAGEGRAHGQVTLNDLWALKRRPSKRRI